MCIFISPIISKKYLCVGGAAGGGGGWLNGNIVWQAANAIAWASSSI